MFGATDLQRTEATEESYAHRCMQLILRYAREQDIALHEVLPSKFVAWLIKHANTLRYNTFRQYKAAVVFALPELCDGKTGLHSAVHDLKNAKFVGLHKGHEARTSSAKAKMYSPIILDRILEEIAGSPDKYIFGKLLAAILVATNAVGLRLVEWGQATLITDIETRLSAIYVRNAKATNGRSFGPYRTIIYGHFSHSIRNSIEFLVKEANKSEYWPSIQKKIADLHYRLQKRMHPRAAKRFSIYSARHQFIANLKRAHRYEDISALAGHGSTRTATAHYGLSSAGRGFISRSISNEDDAVFAFPSADTVVAFKKNGRVYEHEDSYWIEKSQPGASMTMTP